MARLPKARGRPSPRVLATVALYHRLAKALDAYKAAKTHLNVLKVRALTNRIVHRLDVMSMVEQAHYYKAINIDPASAIDAPADEVKAAIDASSV